MRAALWFLALFGVAVVSAMLLGDNQGAVTVFWSPYRVDLSLNLTLLALLFIFCVLHFALKALAALFSMPDQARRWRLQRRERALHQALLETLSHLTAGRFIRSRKSAQQVLEQEASLAQGGIRLESADKLRTLAHLLAAESAHALQDKADREKNFQQALAQSSAHGMQESHEGVQLYAARWALDDRDAIRALQCLDQLPQGAGHRTLALRLRLKGARLAGQSMAALETARLLVKHRAFSPAEASSLVQGLALELVRSAQDADQLKVVWKQLDMVEQRLPEVAMCAAQRMLSLGNDLAWSRQCLLPLWEQWVQASRPVDAAVRLQLIKLLARDFYLDFDAPEAAWLTRIEAAQMHHSGDATVQYLAGIICLRMALWGKAQQLLNQCVPLLQDAEMKRHAWRALAELAEQRADEKAALAAYRNAAL